jgi:hypothetical protein
MGIGMLEVQSFETSNVECVTLARKSLESGKPVMLGYLKDGRLRIARGVVRELTIVGKSSWRIAMMPLNGAIVSDESWWTRLAKAS